MCKSVLLGLLTGVFGILPSIQADDAAPIEIDGCHVHVIDRAVLASGQTGIVGTEVPPEGTVVQKDQIVVRLADEVPQATLAMAQAQASNDVPVRSAEKTTQVAYKEYERAVFANRQKKDLVAVSELEVQRLLLTAEESALKIEQAKLELQLAVLKRNEAEALLHTYRVRAPFDGVVTRRYKMLGEAVRQGDPILEIVSVARVRIEAEVPVAQRGAVQIGMRVWIEAEEGRADSGRRSEGGREPVAAATTAPSAPRLEGRIVFIDPVAEPVSRTIRVHAEVDNTSGILLPGLYARMIVPPPASP